MGYAPDWNKGSMKKTGATPVKQGVVCRELFHGAKAVQKFADGGDVELNIRGQEVGKYEGNDDIVKYRMNMTDDVGGKSLRYKDNPDMMAEKPMPESRPYDSIDAILEAKATKESKKSDDGGAKFLATQANKAATAISTPRASAPKTKASSPRFSDDARSPDQVAPPSEFREEAGDTSRNDVRDDFPEEAGAGVPSSKREKKVTTTNKPQLYYGKK